MYAARGHIQKVTGRSRYGRIYFTQTLLPDYVMETRCRLGRRVRCARAFQRAAWRAPLRTRHVEVRDYLEDLHDPSIIDAGFSRAGVDIFGPSGNFGALLFIEKEGFDTCSRRRRSPTDSISPIMSTKGMSVTAARELADEICHDHDIPLLLVARFRQDRLLNRRNASARYAPL